MPAEVPGRPRFPQIVAARSLLILELLPIATWTRSTGRRSSKAGVWHFNTVNALLIEKDYSGAAAYTWTLLTRRTFPAQLCSGTHCGRCAAGCTSRNPPRQRHAPTAHASLPYRQPQQHPYPAVGCAISPAAGTKSTCWGTSRSPARRRPGPTFHDLTRQNNVARAAPSCWGTDGAPAGAGIRPDVLHAHQVASAGWLAAAAGYHPWLVTAWGSGLLLGVARLPLQRQLARWAPGRADYVTCVSVQLVERPKALGAAGWAGRADPLGRGHGAVSSR